MSPDANFVDRMLEERFRLEHILHDRENMLAKVERDASRFERVLTELADEGNERAAAVLREAELDYP